MQLSDASSIFAPDLDNNLLPMSHVVDLPYPDYLARSVYVHRTWSARSSLISRWEELESVTPTQADRDCAESIKQYYRNRLVLKALKHGQITQFTQDLYQLIDECVTPTTAHLGMIYRLPYFYYEDLARDRLAEQFTNQQLCFASALFHDTIETQVLSPVEKVLRSRQGSEVNEYWFANSQQQPVLVSISTSNTLTHLINGLFEWSTVSVSGYYKPSQMRGIDLKFYHLYHFTLTPPVP